MRDGVDVGDAQRVGHQGTGRRTTPGAHPDVDGLRVVDEVRDDQEVRREALVADDLDLVVRPVDVVPADRSGEAPLQSRHHLVLQPGGLVVTVGHREDRHPVARLPHVGVRRDALGDQQSRVTGPRDLVVPQCPHLGGGLEEVTVAVELEPVGVRERLAGLDTQQRLVVLRGVAGDVVAVVGGQRRDVEFASHLQQSLADAALDVEAVIHQFEEEVLRAEYLAPLRCGFQRLALVPEPQPGLHLARGAPGGGDDALRMLGDHLGIHP